MIQLVTPRFRRRNFAVLAAVLLSSFSVSAPVQADTSYPNKAVRIVCAFPPGNASDIVARILADRLAKIWGQPVVVENRPGASGMIAASAVKQAAPDGYTLLMTSTSFIVNEAVLKDVSYDFRKDFTAVSLINSVPVILLVNKDFPAKNMKEWLEEVKGKPGAYSYAHPGVGTIHNLSTKMLQQKTGTKMLELPYKGSVQALTDIIGGNGDMMFEAANSAYSFVQAGRVRALATSGPNRYYALPDVPTLQESGIDISAVGFTALVAPSGTSSQLVDKINNDVMGVLAEEGVKAAMEKNGMELYPPKDASAVQAWFSSEAERWAQVAKAANIQPQ